MVESHKVPFLQDMYIIVPAADPDYYLWREQMVAYNRRNESIPVKNEKPYSVEIVETVYGPIVNDVMDIEGPKMAFKWVGNEDNDTTPAALYVHFLFCISKLMCYARALSFSCAIFNKLLLTKFVQLYGESRYLVRAVARRPAALRCAFVELHLRRY